MSRDLCGVYRVKRFLQHGVLGSMLSLQSGVLGFIVSGVGFLSCDSAGFCCCVIGVSQTVPFQVLSGRAPQKPKMCRTRRRRFGGLLL